MPHAQHPSYEALINRMFRSMATRKPVHLTTIRGHFRSQYLPRYRFPPSWPRHLAQRLRELEKSGTVVSSGAHQLFFRPTHAAVKARPRVRPKTKRAPPSKRAPRSKSAPPTKRAKRLSSRPLTPPSSGVLVKAESPQRIPSDDALQQCLDAFEPYTDVQMLHGRLAAQVQILVRAIRAQASGDTEALSAIQTDLDSLLSGAEEAEVNLVDFAASLRQLGEIAEQLQRENLHAGKEGVEPELCQAIESLERIILKGRLLAGLSMGDALSTVSTLIFALLATIRALRKEQMSIIRLEQLEADLERSLRFCRREEQLASLASEHDRLKDANARLSTQCSQLSECKDKTSQLASGLTACHSAARAALAAHLAELDREARIINGLAEQ